MSRTPLAQPSVQLVDHELQEIALSRPPDIEGRSKRLWLLPDDKCYVEHTEPAQFYLRSG